MLDDDARNALTDRIYAMLREADCTANEAIFVLLELLAAALATARPARRAKAQRRVMELLSERVETLAHANAKVRPHGHA